MHTMHAHIADLLYQLGAWCAAHRAPVRNGVMAAGLITAIWSVIVEIFNVVSKFWTIVSDAAALVFHTVEEVASFAAKGIVWITASVRSGLSALVSGLKSVYGTIVTSLQSVWDKVSDFFEAVKRFLKPYIDFLNKIKTLYTQYWNEFVKPVLTAISRVRQALQIFKFFHLQWAQQLDNWLAEAQQQIIKNTQWVYQQLNMIINWANAICDPFGFMRLNPMLGGFVNGVNSFWMAMTGTAFFGAALTGGTGKSTAQAPGYFQQQAADIKNKTGDAGDAFSRQARISSALRSEMGVS